MAESLNAEQLAERRSNLQAFRALLDMEDDSELTTTLLMQEEWLATVDELQEYARDAHIIRGLRTRKCLHAWGLGDNQQCSYHFGELRQYCGPCYLRAIHEPKDLPLDVDEYGWATGIALAPNSLVTLPLDENEPEYAQGMSPEEAMDLMEEEPNECGDSGQAHIWVKVGTVGFDDAGMTVVDWSDAQCLRCRIPMPVPAFVEDEFFTDL